jgi:hypothetical protein
MESVLVAPVRKKVFEGDGRFRRCRVFVSKLIVNAADY